MCHFTVYTDMTGNLMYVTWIRRNMLKQRNEVQHSTVLLDL